MKRPDDGTRILEKPLAVVQPLLDALGAGSPAATFAVQLRNHGE
ncbi:MAG: hypothetical protein ACREFD_05375 [Stellaceae bacterium]